MSSGRLLSPTQDAQGELATSGNSKGNAVTCWTHFTLHLSWLSTSQSMLGAKVPICAIMVQVRWRVDHSDMIKITPIFSKLPQLKSFYYLTFIIMMNGNLRFSFKAALTYTAPFVAPRWTIIYFFYYLDSQNSTTSTGWIYNEDRGGVMFICVCKRQLMLNMFSSLRWHDTNEGNDHARCDRKEFWDVSRNFWTVHGTLRVLLDTLDFFGVKYVSR